MPRVRAVTRHARRCVVGEDPHWSEVAVNARLAVDARRVGVAVVADSAAEILAVEVHAQAQRVHSLVEVALGGVPVAVALLAFERIFSCVPTPRLLCEPVQALVTVDSGCPKNNFITEQNKALCRRSGLNPSSPLSGIFFMNLCQSALDAGE